MLEALRRATSTWIAKVLIGLLVISFAVWGVSDIFSGPGQAELIAVGEEVIVQEEYQRAVQLEQRQMASERGTQLSLSEARAQGLDRRVMTRLIGGAAIDSHASQLDLGITEQAVAEHIMREPSFQDAAGNFSRLRLQQILYANDLNEQNFVSAEREAVIRNQLTETIAQQAPIPQTLLDAINRFSRQTRVLKYIEVPLSAAGEIPAPTEEQLKTYYENNKGDFTAPEYRRAGLIVATPETVTGVEISEDELRAAYGARKSELGKPERRAVQQITFPSMEEAKEAYARIQSGTDFMEVAKERGLSEKDVSLGVLQREQFADDKIGEIAFGLEEGAVSEPIAGEISTALIRVTKIEGGESKTFEEAKPELEKMLKQERAATRIGELYGKVEDERAAGASLEEAAKALELPYREIEIDSNGKTAKGESADLPNASAIVSEIFKTDPGVEANAIEVEGPGYVWYQVLGVTPPRLKPFDEVRAKVEEGWRQAEQRSVLSRFSRDLVERLRKGEDMAEIAKAWGGEVQTTQPLTRAGGGGLPASISAVSQAFALPPGAYGSAAGASEDSRLVFQVAKVNPPGPQSEEEQAKIREGIAPLLADDLVAQYVAGLQRRYGVDVNRDALERLTGGQL